MNYLESLAIVILMVTVVMAIILGLIYLLGELFNIISKFGQPKQRRQSSDDVKPASRHNGTSGGRSGRPHRPRWAVFSSCA